MRRPAQSPYVTLGVPVDATEDQIRRAFRVLAGEHHPDKQPPEAREAAGVRFAPIAEAYGILSNAVSRRQYDRAESPYEHADDAGDGAEGVPADFRDAIDFAKAVGPEVVDAILAADTDEALGARAARAARNLGRGVLARTKTAEGQAQLRSVARLVWDGLLGLERTPP